jgi:uncharacterized repeat protein (TIGR01451 family)
VALASSAVGLAADRPELLLAAAVGVVFAAYPRLTGTPDPTLELERDVSDRSPAPGDEVDVTVRLRNAGDATLVDLRVVDGVPPALSVVAGSPRRGLALRPGATREYAYTVEAEPGTHSFEPATAVARDLSGATEVETTAAADTTVDCTASAAGKPQRDLTLEQVGRVLSSAGGGGTEFHRTREYRHGDPTSRIDWKRYARSGDLTTVEFREERASSVVLLVDAREPAYRAPGDRPHGVVHCVSAARQLLDAFLSRRNRVGVAAFGRELCWHAPGTGRDHADDAHRVFSTHPAFRMSPPRDDVDLDAQTDSLRARLPDASQVVLLSPLTDDGAVAAAKRLEAHGHPVSVVSPDVTSDDTTGERLARVERENRLRRLRQAAIPTVDWRPETPLGAALANARGGSSWTRA